MVTYLDISIAARHYVSDNLSLRQLFERGKTLVKLQNDWNLESDVARYFTSLTCQFPPNFWTKKLQRQYSYEAKMLEKGGVRPVFVLNDGSIGAGTTYADRLFNDKENSIRVQLDVDAINFDDPGVRKVIEIASFELISKDVTFGVLMKGNIKRLHGDSYLNFKRLALECLFSRYALGKMPYAKNNPLNVSFAGVPRFFIENGDHFPGLNIVNAESTHFEAVARVVNSIVAQNPGFLIEYYNSIFVDLIYGGPAKTGFVIPVRSDDFDCARNGEAVDRYIASTIQTMLTTDLKDILVEDILSGNALRDLNAADLSCNGECPELKNKAVSDFIELITPVAQACK